MADADALLVERAKAGDFAAFEALVNQYERQVFALAMRIVRHRADAEEVVQDTFLSLIERIGTFSGRSTFRTWLLRVATNQALLVLRKRRRRNAKVVDISEDESADELLPHPDFIARWKNDPHTLAANSETRQRINAELDKLDEKYRLVFVLRDIEGLSTEEAAEALGISVANAKVRLLRARLMLREQLTRAFGDPQQQLPHSHAGHEH